MESFYLPVEGFPCRKREILSGGTEKTAYFPEETRASLHGIAALLIGPGVKIEDGEIGRMAAQTLAVRGKTVEDPVFTVGEYAVRADFLRPADAFRSDGRSVNGEGYELILVRDLAKPHPRQKRELAMIAVFAERSGFPVARTTLAYADPSFVREKDGDMAGLIRFLDVTDEVSRLMPAFRTELKKRLSETASGAESCVLRQECFSGADCPFARQCSGVTAKEGKGPDVFDIPGIGGKELIRALNDGKTDAEELLRSGKLNRMQAEHVRLLLSGQTRTVDRAGLAAWLEHVREPVWFLDFEGDSSAVPPFEGMKPFDTLPFAFSLFREDDPDGGYVFFRGPETDPREEMARELISRIKEPGTVLAYDRNYEKTVLKLLADQYPAYAQGLERIRAALVDLSTPFRDLTYYDVRMNGSVSLKSVSPALSPADPALSYDMLASVKNGSDAVAAYRRMRSCGPKEREELTDALVAYSRMDTYTMVRILRRLREETVES